MKQFYLIFNNTKWSAVSTVLTWSHYTELLPLKNKEKIYYYYDISISNNLGVRELRDRIKSNEYERLPEETKKKLLTNDNYKVEDFIKNPIFIKNINNYEVISEKILQRLILEDIPSFLKELGNGFSFISNEYKIKIGDSYNYIDLLLFNIDYNCYAVVELKVTEIKKEHLGEIQVYMN